MRMRDRVNKRKLNDLKRESVWERNSMRDKRLRDWMCELR